MMLPAAHGIQADGRSAHLGAGRFVKAEQMTGVGPAAEDRSPDLRRRYAIATAAHGAALMLAGCMWGLLPPSATADGRAFIAVHHMLAHQGELLFGMACAWQFLAPSIGRRWMRALFWLTVVGAWCNPLGYFIAAVSGQGSDLVAHATKHLHARGPWTTASETVLKTLVAPSNLLSFGAWLVLLLRSYASSAAGAAPSFDPRSDRPSSGDSRPQGWIRAGNDSSSTVARAQVTHDD